MNRLDQEVQEITRCVRLVFTQGVRGSVQVVGSAISLFMCSPLIGSVLAVVLPVLVASGNLLGIMLRSMKERAKDSTNKASAAASEALQHISTVHAYCAESVENERYGEALAEAARLKTQMAMATGVYFGLVR